MATKQHIYGKVNNKTDLKRIFMEIRRDVENAHSRRDLTELYRRAGYLITLTRAPSWEKKFGSDAAVLRDLGEEEFRKTAKKINQRAKQVGTEPDYDDSWGGGRKR